MVACLSYRNWQYRTRRYKPCLGNWFQKDDRPCCGITQTSRMYKQYVPQIIMAEEFNENFPYSKTIPVGLDRNFGLTSFFDSQQGNSSEKKIFDFKLRVAITNRSSKGYNNGWPLTDTFFNFVKIYPVLQSVQILGAWYNSEIRPSTWRDVNKRIPWRPI